MIKNNIYDLELFEEYIIFNNGACTETFKRVPGGWIYILCNNSGSTSSFVPWHNEFI